MQTYILGSAARHMFCDLDISIFEELGEVFCPDHEEFFDL